MYDSSVKIKFVNYILIQNHTPLEVNCSTKQAKNSNTYLINASNAY